MARRTAEAAPGPSPQPIHPMLTVSIAAINLDPSNPAIVSPPGPWLVTGKVRYTTPATAITEMAYSVGDGPVRPFAPPMDPVKDVDLDFFFYIDAEDILGNGTYLLTVYARDDSPDFKDATKNIQASGFPAGGGGVISGGEEIP
jgi:hypothetical protein